MPSPLPLFSDTTSTDQDLEELLEVLEEFLSSAEVLFLSGEEVPDTTLSSLSLVLSAVSDSLSLLELEEAASDLLGESELAEEFLVALSLPKEELRDFLEVVLLPVELLVVSVFEDADDGDEMFSGLFLLFLLFEVGSIGSHLTRAAFVDLLASVFEVRLYSHPASYPSPNLYYQLHLLLVAVVVDRIGLRAVSL